MLTENQINALTDNGFKRWTKGNIDRLYINASQLGLHYDRYNTGNIRYAEFNGEHISNCCCRKMLETKTYIDINTGKLYSGRDDLKEAAKKLMDAVIA